LSNDRISVVRIIARLNVGGPARHVTWLTAGLRHAGYEAILVTGTVPPGEDDMSYFARAEGIESLIIPEMSREISVKDARTIWKLYRLLIHLQPDIVHTHTAKAGTVGRIAGLLYRWLTPAVLLGHPRRCRFVHTYHGHIFHSYYGRFKTRVFLLIEKILARVATDRIIVISPRQYHEIHEEFGVGRAAQFSVITLGLDLGVFANWQKRRPILRKELAANDVCLLVGIVGRLTEIKNHKLFLQAAALYKKRYETHGAPHVRFVIIGDGHLRHALETGAHALGIEKDVTFMGTRDDPENFYPALDIVALTSLNEGTPLTLIEAMANARAVIATAVGGVGDLLGASAKAVARSDDAYTVCERGVLVRPNDAEAFSRGLRHLTGDEELRREMGERGRLFIERNSSKERLVADVIKLYGELLAPEKAGAIEQSPEGSARRI